MPERVNRLAALGLVPSNAERSGSTTRGATNTAASPETLSPRIPERPTRRNLTG